MDRAGLRARGTLKIEDGMWNFQNASMAQPVARLTLNQRVVGSSPTGRTLEVSKRELLSSFRGVNGERGGLLSPGL